MLALALCLTAPIASVQAPTPQGLTHEAMTAWRDHLAPRPAEDRWRQIPWQQSLGDGLRTAARRDKPMLLWLMNGHPLGCT